MLARALVSPSKLLFLDEPTGSMDTQTELYFIEHLKTALAPDQTLIVATHRHNMLSILDRLIVIDGGKIIADGPRDEVLKHLTAAPPPAAASRRSQGMTALALARAAASTGACALRIDRWRSSLWRWSSSGDSSACFRRATRPMRRP